MRMGCGSVISIQFDIEKYRKNCFEANVCV